MAKNVLITEEVSCDNCNEGLGQDEGRTDHWSVNGEHLEMDLCAQCQALFEADIERWLRISRPDGKGYRKEEAAKTTGTITRPLGDPALAAPKRTAPKGKSAAAAKPKGRSKWAEAKARSREGIRQWAAENNIKCPPTGRVPKKVTDAWDKAHPEWVAAQKALADEQAEDHSSEFNLLTMNDTAVSKKDAAA